jgi:(S)-2-hydroxyglutarate dehydrogenase
MAQGAELKTRAGVEAVIHDRDALVLETTAGSVRSRFLVNCAGLQSDRVARMAGVDTKLRIVPFRGEYFELRADRRHLVRNLIYPVPDPSFPFLGVHFTRMIGGSVHAGPNAVLGLKREGYEKWEVRVPDLVDVLAYPGFWELARRNWRSGLAEMVRSFDKPSFVRSLQRLVPEVRAEDLIPSAAGVRAQGLWPDGTLADDFVIESGPRSLHVLNAPSPAATASIEIGRSIARQIPAEVTGIV